MAKIISVSILFEFAMQSYKIFHSVKLFTSVKQFAPNCSKIGYTSKWHTISGEMWLFLPYIFDTLKIYTIFGEKIMAKVKYIRISTEEQNIERQNRNANEFAKVYIDRVSGTVRFSERKEAKKLLKDIDAGLITEVHVSSIDRLGRNILDILTVIEYLNERSVSLFVENIGMFSMAEGKLNPAFKMIISVLGNVAEMERDVLKERQKQGIEVAKAKGKYTGRQNGTKMTDEQLLSKYKVVVKELTENKQSLRRAAKLGGCSPSTAQKVKQIIERKNTKIHSTI